jgi:DNA polymerase I-like protein with 3'-5' exonuclease and polymerase domains
VLKLYDIPRDKLHLTNACLCAPPENFTAWREAVACCRPRLINELKSLLPLRWILALGDSALMTLLGKPAKIMNTMGGVITRQLDDETEWNILPAYHPSYLLKLEGAPWRPVAYRHYARAWKLATGTLAPWQWPKEHLEPTADMVAALERILAAKKPVGFDVETQGDDPREDKVMCLSIANEDEGVSTPWESYGNRHGNYPGLSDYQHGDRIRALVKAILEDPAITKLMHNGQYDRLSVEKYGLSVLNWQDTMLAHAVLYPTIRHRLNDVACQFTHADRWKDAYKALKDEKSSNIYVDAPAIDTRDYNFKDSAIMPFIWAEELKELQTRWPEAFGIYDKLFEITQDVAVPMTTRGVLVDLTPFNGHIKRLKGQARAPLKQLEVLWVMLEAREKGVTPAQMQGAKAVAKNRRKHSRLSETALIAKHLGIEMFNPNRSAQTHRLFFRHLGAAVVARTDKGTPALNKTALTVYIGDTDQMLSKAATLFLKHKKTMKLIGFMLHKNINKVRIKPLSATRGIAHPTWKTHGTKTGRWSSPIMIIPKPLRNIFIPHHPNGWIVECDWRQLEVRIMAHLAGDPELIRQIMADEDVYVWAAAYIYEKTYAEIKAEGKESKKRKLAKAFSLGRNYGAGDMTLLENLRPSFPGLRLVDIARAREKIEAAYPVLEAHRRRLKSKAVEDDFVEEPFDRRREYFWGSPEPTKVLNFGQQSGGAALIRAVAVEINKELNWQDEGILMQYHDALILDGPDPIKLYRLFHKHMRFVLGPMLYDIEVSVGRNWRDVTTVHSEEDITKLMEA